MFDIIRDALIWLMSWVLDRRPHESEAFRLLLLIAVTGVATWLSIYWRDLALRSSSIRRKLLPEERYAGRYLQAVLRKGNVRYSIINIFYNRQKRRFEVVGRVYSPAGDFISAFKASYVLFPSDKDENIEFVWQGNRAASGYTRMMVEDADEDLIQGDGLVTTFNAQPQIYPIKFKHLHDHYVREALGIDAPTHPNDEGVFVEKFHARYGDLVEEGLASAEKLAA